MAVEIKTCPMTSLYFAPLLIPAPYSNVVYRFKVDST